jgi:hypothetical protein
VVFRDAGGKFARRSARERQSVQVIGAGKASAVKRRRRSEVAEAISELTRPREEVYSATTRKGSMAERALRARLGGAGRYVAFAFSRGKRSGVFTCAADELSFVYTFERDDLQEAIAGILTAYFERAHAERLRVSNKAEAADGYHRDYDRVSVARVVWRLT